MGKPLRQQGNDSEETEPAADAAAQDLEAAPPPVVVPPAIGGGRRWGGAGASRPLVDEDRKLPFEQVHKKYQEKIYNVILRFIGGDHNEAEDLTVETFTNAFRAWDRFRGDAKVSTWLYQIAHNCCKNRFQQRDRQREREAMSLDDGFETDSGGELSREVADSTFAPEQILLNQELAEKIREAIDALPDEYRIVLILDQREDMSYEEIANITGLTVSAVKTRLHRARNKVRLRLEPYYRNWSGKDR